ncbi:hypothetical protein ACFPN2_00225 [Steroidobacter flavus]|uniref:3-keto-disaccharide hydrolase domain-containing protein n=1 Tax=Steroidobacter flavus TaxID=1842136 RepID=A0ABV8SLK3_9GAMM
MAHVLRKNGTAAFIALTLASATAHAAVQVDNFNRANATPLGGNWETITANGLNLASNQVTGSTGLAVSGWKAASFAFAADQSSEVKVLVPGDYDDAGIGVRLSSTGGGQGYVAQYRAGDGRVYVSRLTAGALTTLIAPVVSWTSGDVLKLTVTGTMLEVFRNGVSIGSTTDSTHASGQPGLVYQLDNLNVTRLDDWQGQDGSSGSVDGVVLSGGVLTITKTAGGFGTKSMAAPFHYQDYDSEVDNTRIDAIAPYEAPDPAPSASILPRISTDRAHNGTKAVKQIYPVVLPDQGTFPKVGISELNSLELYVSFWGYWERTSGSGDYGGIFKLVRAGSFPWYHSSPAFYESHGGHDSSGVTTANDTGFNTPLAGTTYVPYLGDPPPQGFDAGGWHFFEYYYRLSNPAGSANGAFQSTINGTKNADFTANTTRDAGSSALIDYTMTLFDGMDSNTDDAYEVFQDEFYVDTSPKKVIVTNSSVGPRAPNSSNFAIQIPISWSDTKIEATFNQSGFACGSTGHVWVFTAFDTYTYEGQFTLPSC